MVPPAQDPFDVRREVRAQDEHGTNSIFDPAASTAQPAPRDGAAPFLLDSGPVLAGDALAPYRIVRALGQGGMGAVYEAVDPQRNLRVALKTLRPEVHASLSRFSNEFHALAELRHENLVRIHELVTDGPVAFYTMELVEGVDFRTWVLPTADASASDAFDVLRLRQALRQLMEALAYIHQAGHLHRDLKPSNVLVTRDGTVKVLDFGLAARIDHRGLYENSAPGQAVGTLAYMAPEQAAGEDLTPAADWYSVGVVLFECLMGRLPFKLNTLYELQEQKLRGVHLAPSRWSDTDLGRLCEALLRADPAQRPTAEEALRVVGSEQPGTHRSAARVELIGRSAQLDALRSCFELVEQQERACAVFVRGPSGMGKSELLRCFLDEVRDTRRAEIFRGRCYDSVFAPYKAFESIIVALARRLERMDMATLRAVTPLDVGPLCDVFPVLAEAFAAAGAKSAPRKMMPPEKRHRAFAALRELIARLGPRGPLPASRPLILFIDDLQWGDVDSAVLLADLLRAPAPPLLLVGAFRSEDEVTSPCLQALLSNSANSDASSDAERTFIEVGPLDTEQAAAMAGQLLGKPAAEGVCQQIARESNGNPLFVQELARSLAAGSQVSGQMEAGLRLEKVLWQRIESIPPEQRQLLFVVAAAERPLERPLAYHAAGLERQDPALCDDLTNDRLLRTMGSTQHGHFDTYHDRVRETILSRLERSQRCSLHRQIARCLEAAGSTDDQFIGQQLFAAGDIEPACQRFRRAADQAAEALAFDRAARLYRTVLDYQQGAAADVGLRRQLATALANTGRCAEAAEQCLAAATYAAHDEALKLQCDAALRYLTSGHIHTGMQTLRAALDSAGMRLPRTKAGTFAAFGWWRAKLAFRSMARLRPKHEIPAKKLRQLDTCWSAVAGLSLVDPLRAAVFVPRNLYLAMEAGEPERLLRALAVYSGHAAIGGSRSRGAAGRVLNQLHSVAAAVEGLYPQAILNLARGIIAHLQGRWDEACQSSDEAELLFQSAEQQDIAWEVDSARTFAMWARMYAGRWRELAERQPELRREAIERNDLFARLNFGARMASCVLLAADRPQDARKVIDEDRLVAVAGAFHVQHHNLLLARVFISLYEGDATGAWELMADAWRLYHRSLLSYVQQVRVDFFHMQGTAALAAAAVTRDQRFFTATRKIIHRLQCEPVDWAQAIAQLFEAQLQRMQGQPDSALAKLQSACERLERAQMSLLAAAARWTYSEWAEDDVARHTALQKFQSEQIVDPQRVAKMFLPAG